MIRTIQSLSLKKLKKYFDDKYKIKSRKEFSFATTLDPRCKSSGFRDKDKAGLTRELITQEIIAKQHGAPIQ